MNDIDDELDLVQEKQEEQAREEKIEGKMFSDIEFCAEQTGAFEALTEIEDAVARINCYGHEITVKEFIEEYL